MGNSSSKKSNDVTVKNRGFSPFRGSREKTVSPLSNGFHGGCSSTGVLDVPGKPGRAVVSLTNLQSEKPSGSCVTDSIYLDWTSPLEDGGTSICGYSVEMYDLPTGNWVMVTQTDGSECRSILDNILCGIMYRFRVRAINEVGTSAPGIPSDAFVIDTPGVHIAPYFIICPPPEVEKFCHDKVQFRAKALGTPKPNILWQKDDEPIFIDDGIDIIEENDGSLLTVHNLQCEDEGVIQCVAVNHVGKAVASTNLRVVATPQFTSSNTTSHPLHFTFHAEELVRLKFPFIAQPSPEIQVHKNSLPVAPQLGKCEVSSRDEQVIFKIGNASLEDSGYYTIIADNGYGQDEINYMLDIEVPPDPPGVPDILDVTPTGQLTLAWEPPNCPNIDHYIIEYFRDQWQLWLRMKTSIDTSTIVTDLIPGSKYKFRIMSASETGISEPSGESEEVMIGKAPEDELFDLPDRMSATRRGRMFAKTRKIPSLDRSSLDRSNANRSELADVNRRHTSLDREVYYDSENVRRDVVTYKGIQGTEQIGETVSSKYSLSNQDLNKYKSSMTNLCNKMKAISANTAGSSGRLGSRSSGLNDSMLALKLEVSNQARKSTSLNQISREVVEHIEGGYKSLRESGQFPAPSSHSLRSLDVTHSAQECKKSLTDIKDRIGSLQSLLKASRSVTSSRQNLFSDLPALSKVQPDPISSEIGLKRKTSLSNRTYSYSQAIEDDPSGDIVPQYQETDFPYNPDSVGSLLCDKPENRQESQEKVVKESEACEIPAHIPTCLSPEDRRASFYMTEVEGDVSSASEVDKSVEDFKVNTENVDPSNYSQSDMRPDSTVSSVTFDAQSRPTSTLSELTMVEESERSFSTMSTATIQADEQDFSEASEVTLLADE